MRIAAFVALLVVTTSAHAQELDDEARALFVAGRSAYDAGRFEDALTRFQEAYDRSGRPELLYNVGMAADRLRQDQRALEAFEAYLRRLPHAENRASVENRIQSLREAIERRQAEPIAPPPEQVAQRAMDAQPPPEPSSEGSVATKWWFWTLIGLVVGGVVAGVVIAKSGDTRQDPVEGDYGVVVMTLGRGR